MTENYLYKKNSYEYIQTFKNKSNFRIKYAMLNKLNEAYSTRLVQGGIILTSSGRFFGHSLAQRISNSSAGILDRNSLLKFFSSVFII